MERHRESIKLEKINQRSVPLHCYMINNSVSSMNLYNLKPGREEKKKLRIIIMMDCRSWRAKEREREDVTKN